MHVLYEEPAFVLKGEDLLGNLYLHVNIHKFSPKIFKRMMVVLWTLRKELEKEGQEFVYIYLNEYQGSMHKFARMLGFIEDTEVNIRVDEGIEEKYYRFKCPTGELTNG